MNDWAFDIGPYRVAAERSGHVSVVLDVVDGGIDVDCEQGDGYEREQCSFHIPIEVIRKLLAGHEG